MDRLLHYCPIGDEGVFHHQPLDPAIQNSGMQSDDAVGPDSVDRHCLDVRARRQPIHRTQHVVDTKADDRTADEESAERQQVEEAEIR